MSFLHTSLNWQFGIKDTSEKEVNSCCFSHFSCKGVQESRYFQHFWFQNFPTSPAGVSSGLQADQPSTYTLFLPSYAWVRMCTSVVFITSVKNVWVFKIPSFLTPSPPSLQMALDLSDPEMLTIIHPLELCFLLLNLLLGSLRNSFLLLTSKTTATTAWKGILYCAWALPDPVLLSKLFNFHFGVQLTEYQTSKVGDRIRFCLYLQKMFRFANMFMNAETVKFRSANFLM